MGGDSAREAVATRGVEIRWGRLDGGESGGERLGSGGNVPGISWSWCDRRWCRVVGRVYTAMQHQSIITFVLVLAIDYNI